MNIQTVISKLKENEYEPVFQMLYGTNHKEIAGQKERYLKAISEFCAHFPGREDIHIFSAPGRTEIGGNHTDHQHGCVLAAAVNMDIIGVVSFHNEGVIRVLSEGYEPFSVSAQDVEIRDNAKDSASLVRGIIAGFLKKGISVGGFDVYCTSDVLCGSGISSSAAFEVLMGTIIDGYYADQKVGPVEIAKIGQFSENVYFGKKSGLMDQMVSSVGGLVFIDFFDTENPTIESFRYDFETEGYILCLTDTKGSHANLTDDYVAIRSEMESVAAEFNARFLREVEEARFYEKLPALRKKCTDRALVRAMHFFAENRRAMQEAEALKKGCFVEFLRLVRESGESSARLLQNLYTCHKPGNQEIPLAIALSQRVFAGSGAVRVHGGGFAGTIQAFVPEESFNEYQNEMNRIFGEGACVRLRIRSVGGVEVTKE